MSQDESVTPQQAELNERLAQAVVQKDTPLAAIRSLLRSGADANAPYQEKPHRIEGQQCSLLHVAARNSRADVLELLLSHGAHVNAQDYEGYTPLQTAAWRGNSAAMQALAEAGADAHYRTNYGNSLAHSAMLSQQLHTLPYSLQLGASVDVHNSRTTTPMDYARSRGVYKHAEQLVAAARPWPRLKITKDDAGNPQQVSKEQLFSENKNGFAPLEHPATWHELDAAATPLSRADLMQKKDSQGRPWLIRGIECRQLQKMHHMLEKNGESFGLRDWLDTKGKPTEALNTLVRKESLNDLFRGVAGNSLHTQELRHIYQALPVSAREQVNGFQQLIIAREQEAYSRSHHGMGR